MLIYYGLSQFDIVQTGWMNDQPFWLLFRDATFCATWRWFSTLPRTLRSCWRG